MHDIQLGEKNISVYLEFLLCTLEAENKQAVELCFSQNFLQALVPLAKTSVRFTITPSCHLKLYHLRHVCHSILVLHEVSWSLHISFFYLFTFIFYRASHLHQYFFLHLSPVTTVMIRQPFCEQTVVKCFRQLCSCGDESVHIVAIKDIVLPCPVHDCTVLK